MPTTYKVGSEEESDHESQRKKHEKKKREKKIQEDLGLVHKNLNEFEIKYGSFLEKIGKTRSELQKKDVKKTLLEHLKVKESDLSDELKKTLESTIGNVFEALTDSKHYPWPTTKTESVMVSVALQKFALHQQKIMKLAKGDINAIKTQLNSLPTKTLKTISMNFKELQHISTNRKGNLVDAILTAAKKYSHCKKEIVKILADESSFKNSVTDALNKISSTKDLLSFQTKLNLRKPAKIVRVRDSMEKQLREMFLPLVSSTHIDCWNLDFHNLDQNVMSAIQKLAEQHEIDSDSSQASQGLSVDLTMSDMTDSENIDVSSLTAALKTLTTPAIDQIHALCTNKKPWKGTTVKTHQKIKQIVHRASKSKDLHLELLQLLRTKDMLLDVLESKLENCKAENVYAIALKSGILEVDNVPQNIPELINDIILHYTDNCCDIIKLWKMKPIKSQVEEILDWCMSDFDDLPPQMTTQAAAEGN